MKSEGINFMIGFWVQLVTCINQRKGIMVGGNFFCGINRDFFFLKIFKILLVEGS